MKIVRSLLAVMIVLSLQACGSKGASGDEAPGDDGDTDGDGGNEGDVRQVTGAFMLGSKDHPASGYQVWLVDQTSGGYVSRTLGKTGGFMFDLEDFTEDHVYSLHLVDDSFREIGALDLSSLNAGTQAAFVYRGGYGFDLGSIIVSLNARGEVDFDAPSLEGAIGGGFSLRTTTTASLATVPLPKSVESASLASQLLVSDPTQILYSFYQRDTYTDMYKSALATYSRIASVVTPKAAGSVERVFLDTTYDGGSWLGGARLVKDPESLESTPVDSTLWSQSAFSWTARSGDFATYVFTGRPLAINSLIAATVRPKDGAQQKVPLKLTKTLAMIPMLKSIDLTNGGLSVIDYALATGENGLTRPFCVPAAGFSELGLGILPPESQDGVIPLIPLIPSILGMDDRMKISVAADYYSESGGVDSILKVATTDLPNSLQSAISDTLASGATREWDPEAMTTTITPTADPASGAVHAISLWEDLFLQAVGSKSVSKIRLRLSFKTDESPLESSTVIWFKQGC